ncbi:MAG: hypothetical protein ACKPKO_64450, partial [Candidatus Fonsibacter sp.]
MAIGRVVGEGVAPEQPQQARAALAKLAKEYTSAVQKRSRAAHRLGTKKTDPSDSTGQNLPGCRADQDAASLDTANNTHVGEYVGVGMTGMCNTEEVGNVDTGFTADAIHEEEQQSAGPTSECDWKETDRGETGTPGDKLQHGGVPESPTQEEVQCAVLEGIDAPQLVP